jgi:CheY-like chemotaxis protein
MKQGRILIVEDERIIALDVEDMLQSMGYEVVAVMSSGEEAIQKAEQENPDLVLMDINLKGRLDGVDAAKHIRKHLNIPVIYTSGSTDERTMKRMENIEADAFIPKPYSNVELDILIKLTLHAFKYKQPR